MQLGRAGMGPHLTKGQLSLVTYLFEHPQQVIYQRDLEQFLGMSRATINGLVKQLKVAELITVTRDSVDKRYKRVQLLAKVRAQMTLKQPDFERHYQFLETQMTAGLSTAEIEQLRALLTTCLNNLRQQ